MKALLPLVAFGTTLSSALPSQERSTPCPYHKGGTAREPLLKDEYTVELNPGYTLEEHYDFIGFDLSAKAKKFDVKNRLNMYGVKIDEDTMHNIIRYDPGVLRVSHNMVLGSEKPWYKKYTLVNETDADDEPQKRWSRQGGMFHYSTGHINEWE
ncbi:hypothetical protein BU26DRAFT_566386 [Trematosphaeria pertusa]|uniref:Uncharacterized protein n=1 Tax=Trematosphaeria pertusa TaxID=390896 RepID=A0A6A6IBW5_9PLEO|nr:uncharacterized protein BU26DRAFT_566386 [Trematosphaeria pertusa]KAF2247402.1 hypothetical protein BU26DRAFT_566386 [Trematosphaeria pertusa]